MTPLVIIGCGGFGREVVAIVRAINRVRDTYALVGCVDDGQARQHVDALGRLGVPLLGGTEWLESASSSIRAVIAIGSVEVRRQLDDRFRDRSWATLVHPDATVGDDVQLGPGTVVAPGTRLSTGITTGRHVHIDQNATVGHDCRIGAGARLNPQACVSGTVTLDEGVLIGANATVLQGLSIGAGSVVGAGAVVVSNLAANVTVKGVPAR